MVLTGVPERLAMDISGHNTRAIFDRYLIVREQGLADALANAQITRVGFQSPTIDRRKERPDPSCASDTSIPVC